MTPGAARTLSPWTTLALGLAGLTTWIVLVAVPGWQKLADQLEQIEAVQEKVSRGIAARAALTSLQNQVTQYQIEVAALELQIPRQENIPDLVRRLDRLAVQYGISLQQVSRRVTREANQQTATTRIPVVARGSLNAIYAFWRTLLAQERYLNLDQPALSMSDQDILELRFDLLAYTFVQ